MKRWINRALRSARNYSLMDFGFLKLTLISLGILVGAYWSEYFLRHTLFLWCVFLGSYLYILYRTFVSHRY